MIRLLGFALALSMLGGVPAQGQFLHTFTPDPPPVGDGIDYPRTINPARQIPGGGVGADAFDAGSGVVFTNTNANPAFFDGNNLLTRPSSLVTNEAFWTDPKVGTYDGGGFDVEESFVGVQFIPAGGEDFGFDLAIASVGSAVPTSLPVFFQNSSGNQATVDLDLVVGGMGALQPIQAGTFDTLNSVFPAREARYRISHAQLEGILGSPNPVIIFGLEMREIETTNGTTQVAIDNFVIAGAEALPNETQREPVRFQSELIPPGELQYFVFDPMVSQETGIEVDLPPGTRIQLGARTTTPPASAAPDLEIEATVTVPESSDLPAVAPDIGVTAPSDVPGTAPPFVAPLSEVEVHFEGGETGAYHLNTRSFLYDNTPFPLPDPDTIVENETAHVVQQRSHSDLRGTVEAAEALGSDNVPSMILKEGEGGRQARGTGDPFTLYVGFTLDQYLAEKRQLGLEPVVGDSGSALTPVTDDDGQIVDFFVDTWRIADTPGTYIPILLVPEPGAVAMLAIGGLVFGAAARRRRKD